MRRDDPDREIKRSGSTSSRPWSPRRPIPCRPNQAIYQGAIPGMLRTLDPHSIFFDPDQFQQLQQMQRSEPKGFGTIVSMLPGRVIVLQTMEGSPSAKAGLSAGDEILAINNIPLSQLEPDQLIQLLGQARQHDVALDVRQPGNAQAPALRADAGADRCAHRRPRVSDRPAIGFCASPRLKSPPASW